jgi:hypothetical protein
VTDLIHSIFAQVPWLKVFIAWALAVAVVMAALALPAYYILLPVTQRVRAAIARHLIDTVGVHLESRRQRKQAHRDLLSEYAQDHLLRLINESSGRSWARQRVLLLEPIKGIQTGLASGNGNADTFSRPLPDLHDRIRMILEAVPKDFGGGLNDPAAGQKLGTVRVAKMAFWCCLILLAAMIFVNTGMLSQIVRDLGFIPPSLKFLNVPLYFILAFLLTMVEAGLGFIHGVLSDEAKDDRSRIHFGATLFAFGSICLACVEGFFYSRIIPNRTETVTIPVVNYTLPQTDMFFLWGFLLVMTLFGLGMICYNKGAVILRGTAVLALRKELRSLKNEADGLTGALQNADRMAAAAATSVERATAAAAPQTSKSTEVERLLSELRTLLETRSGVGFCEQQMGAPEVRHISVQALLWLAAFLSAAVISVYVGAVTFLGLSAGAGDPRMLAAGQALLASIAGALLGWGETIVQGVQWQKVAAPNHGRLLGTSLVALYLIAYLVLLERAYAEGAIVLWLLNLLVTLALTAACYQLAPLLALEIIWVRKLWDLTASLVEFAYRNLVRIVLWCAIFVDGLVGILAGPLVVFKGRRTATGLSASFANDPR